MCIARSPIPNLAVLFIGLAAVACSSNRAGTGSGRDASAASGGAASTTGGTTAVTTGGAASTGGASTTGGTPGTGGTNRDAAAGGAATTGGLPGTGGSTTGAGGATSAGGTAATGGTTTNRDSGAGGTSPTGGTSRAGGTATNGDAAAGGATNAGGTSATGGTIPSRDAGAGGATSTGGTTSGTCGTINMHPFTDCQFAWGAPSSGSNSSYLDFVSTWVGQETNGGLSSMSATATNTSCNGCSLAKKVASGNAMAVFYAYFIGFDGHAAGLPDCNVGGPPNLCTNASQWVRDNRAILINQYAQYAKAVYAASPNKPVIWWLEGDFVQYTYSGQINAFSYAELGQLARDITCAIKSNEPNAVVAMNHSPWIADNISTAFWSAMPMDVIDMVWVQGPGNSDAFVNAGSYNATTANYAWIYQKTGRTIMAETSYAGSGSDDLWTTTSAANINARIGHGVIGVLVNNPGANYQTAIGTLTPLTATCH